MGPRRQAVAGSESADKGRGGELGKRDYEAPGGYSGVQAPL